METGKLYQVSRDWTLWSNPLGLRPCVTCYNIGTIEANEVFMVLEHPHLEDYKVLTTNGQIGWIHLEKGFKGLLGYFTEPKNIP